MRRLKFAVLMFVSIFALADGVLAQTLVFTLIGDTTTPVPGSGGTFTNFGLPTADRESGTVFCFSGQSSNGVSGVYNYPQTLNEGDASTVAVIADTTMAAPTGGTFSSFSYVTSGWNAMGFVAQGSNGVQGIYAAFEGTLLLGLVAQTGESPSAGVTFGSFQGLSLMGSGDSGQVGNIDGEILSDVGVYDITINYNTYGYPPSPPGLPITFTQVANTSTTPAGASGPFSLFGPPTFKSSTTSDSRGFPGRTTVISAFCATAGGIQGIYYKTGIGTYAQALQLLASTSTLIPSGAGQFTSFGNPAASSDEIAFTAHYSTSTGDQQGIFAYGNYLYNDPGLIPAPTLYQILAVGQTAPDASGAHFASFGTIATSEYGGIFTATLDNGIEGLYTFGWATSYEMAIRGPTIISETLDTSDTLDGKSIADIEISSEATDDIGDAVFKVDFIDGSQGIYYASYVLPEPTCLPLLAVLALLLRPRRNPSR